LIRAGNELAVGKLTIITLDESGYEKLEGNEVEIIAAPQWLMKPPSSDHQR